MSHSHEDPTAPQPTNRQSRPAIGPEADLEIISVNDHYDKALPQQQAHIEPSRIWGRFRL